MERLSRDDISQPIGHILHAREDLVGRCGRTGQPDKPVSKLTHVDQTPLEVSCFTPQFFKHVGSNKVAFIDRRLQRKLENKAVRQGTGRYFLRDLESRG